MIHADGGMAMATYEELRQRHLAGAAALLPGMLERIEWPAQRLAAHRRTELQRLVRVARELSPWHRKRLSDINPDEVDEATLAELPVMTKDDLMAHFDEIVTDDRLRLEVVEAHLEALTTDGYLFDRYHACASGGSSGRRGVFVYDWDGWSTFYWSVLRYEVRALRLDPRLAAAMSHMAVVAADSVTHISSSIGQTFSAPGAEIHRFPVTLSAGEIVAGLNAVQPTILAGYPSGLYALAREAEAGRLRIAPLRIISAAEPLLPEIRAALEETWAAPVLNAYGMSEGGSAVSCGSGPWLHLSDDLAVIEPVDTAGCPVATGVRSDKIYLTTLFNHALPLIRYEVTDQVTLVEGACPCGSVHQRIEDPQGRLDDCFHYGGVAVHPHVFRSALGRCRHVLEYQVRQTSSGAEVAARCTGPVDIPALEAEIAGELACLGLPAPRVTVTPVEHLDRQSSGKLKRFVPLPGA
jgi:phenylacetate-coenzyme A ligase PaaK-like adenylate-forming protein